MPGRWPRVWAWLVVWAAACASARLGEGGLDAGMGGGGAADAAPGGGGGGGDPDDTKGACDPAVLGESYIGCEYFPTVTGNEVDGTFRFAVAVSNASGTTAEVRIDGGALAAPDVFTVEPGGVAVRELPWVAALKACASEGQMECGALQSWSALARGGAYHLVSTEPVTVYQFNPLDFQRSFQYSYSNDAALLYPVNALGDAYVAAAWGVWQSPVGAMPGLVAVTATRDGTRVVVAPTAPTAAGDGAPALTPGAPATFTLDRGDVLQLFAASGDLTGTRVTADAPVQVIGGHYCTQIPHGVPACDHLEESMPPIRALGATYLVTAPAVPGVIGGKAQIVRIVATESGTSVIYDPPVPGAPVSLGAAGSFVELSPTADNFLVTASKKVLVVQYMQGQGAGGDTGDPSMAVAVPIDQYRTSYLFHAPVNYEIGYASVLAPVDATVTLDGFELYVGWPVGDTGWAVYQETLFGGVDGNHVLTGDAPFGVTVYGYGDYTSYWYPGGLDLAPIIIE